RARILGGRRLAGKGASEATPALLEEREPRAVRDRHRARQHTRKDNGTGSAHAIPLSRRAGGAQTNRRVLIGAIAELERIVALCRRAVGRFPARAVAVLELHGDGLGGRERRQVERDAAALELDLRLPRRTRTQLQPHGAPRLAVRLAIAAL